MRKASIAGVAVLLLPGLAGCGRAAPAGGGDAEALRFVRQLKDADDTKRREAAFALAERVASGPAALAPLTEALADKDDTVRAYAARALGKLGPEAGAAVPALIQVMEQDSDATARTYAARALGEIGPAAKAAVPTLLQALSDKVIGEAAAEALAAMGEGAQAAKRLTETVTDAGQSPQARAVALMGLKKAGDRKAVVALMISIVDDKAAVSELRRAATLAVGHMGYEGAAEARAAVPALLANLDQPDVAHSGPWSLWALGATEPAVARLTELVGHRDPRVRAQAASGLGHMAGGNAPPEAKAAVPALIAALKMKDDARTAVIAALGEIGPDAKEALPALHALAAGDDKWLRDRANEAIKQIAPKS